MSRERSRSGYKWLTPDDLPEARPLLRGVYLPADMFILAAFTGALEPLTYAENWEEFGDESPEDTADYFRALVEEFMAGLESSGGGDVPIGTVIQTVTDDVPDGYLECDGSEYDRVDYPALYAVLGSDLIIDADTFEVPDMEAAYTMGETASYPAGKQSAFSIGTYNPVARKHLMVKWCIKAE